MSEGPGGCIVNLGLYILHLRTWLGYVVGICLLWGGRWSWRLELDIPRLGDIDYAMVHDVMTLRSCFTYHGTLDDFYM